MKTHFLPAAPVRDESRLAPGASSWPGSILSLLMPRRFVLSVEANYSAWRDERALNSVRVVLLTATLSFLVFALWDYSVAPAHWTELLPVRGAYSLLSLGLWFGTYFRPLQKRLSLALGLSALGAVVGITCVLNVVPMGFVFGLLGYAYPQLALMVMPNARLAAFNSALITLLVNVSLCVHPVPTIAWVNANFLLLFLCVLTFVFAFVNEARDRCIFDLEQDLQRMATLDSLSGAWNRRHFSDLCLSEIERAGRYKHPLAFLLLDVDHFKSINDSLGHSAGDEAIRALGQTCRETLRASDSLGRIGGEEFAVLLPETELDAAQTLAERLRAAMEHLELHSPNGQPFGFSISLGVTNASEADSFESLFHRADTALYEAKESGRNRVVVA